MPETIWLTAQANALELQARLDAQPEGASVHFAPRREYPGPVVLRKALVLEGSGATLWALAGPVLVVRAAVRLRNLRIEVTGDALTEDEAACAILAAPGGHLTLENVEVRGLVRGLPQEEGVWRYPHGLALGGIAPGVAHHRRLVLHVPVDCRIESHISGLKVTPSELCAGSNDLRMDIDPLPHDFLIDGHLVLSTAALRRRIAVTAYADESPTAPRSQGQILWAPPVEPVVPVTRASAPPASSASESMGAASVPPEASVDAAPVPGRPAPEPIPSRPQARYRTPQLRRDQLPNALFAHPDGPTSDTNPEPSTTPPPQSVPGEIFLADDARPPSPDSPSAPPDLQGSPVERDRGPAGHDADHAAPAAAAGLPKTVRKQPRGVPAQAVFGSESNPAESIATPDPVALPIRSNPSEDRDAASKKRRRSASLPVNPGDAFRPPDA